MEVTVGFSWRFMIATNENQWGTGNPAHIQEMIDALHTADGAVETLKQQLAVVQNARDTIYQELAHFMALRAPINRIPPEILSLIFENCDTEQAMRNATISLVCKSWRNIVNETPVLWSHILVRCSWDVKGLRSLWRYIDNCIGRSKSTPLDIILDMHEILEYSSYLAGILQTPLSWMERDLIDESHSLYVSSRSPQHDDLDGSVHRQYENLTATTIGKLSGALGQHVHRWRSFKLTAPLSISQKGLISIWRALAGYHDALTHFEFWTILAPLEKLPESHVSFPFLPAVRTFATDQNILINRLALNPLVLEKISLQSDVAAIDFLSQAAVVMFSSILALDLSIWQEDSFPSLVGESVFLPQMISLKLRGSSSNKMAPLFKAPRLKALYFQSYRGNIDIENPSILTTLETLNLHVLTGPRRNTRNPLDNEPLKRVLTRCPSLMHLQVSRKSFGEASGLQNAISQLRRGGVPLAQLKKITIIQGTDPFTSKETLLEVVDVSEE